MSFVERKEITMKRIIKIVLVIIGLIVFAGLLVVFVKYNRPEASPIYDHHL